jgi:hypothetical protein
MRVKKQRTQNIGLERFEISKNYDEKRMREGGRDLIKYLLDLTILIFNFELYKGFAKCKILVLS